MITDADKAKEVVDTYEVRANEPLSFSADMIDLIANALAKAKEECIRIADKWDAAYPTDIFPEPPPGEHGKTVDACSARMGRIVARGIAKAIREQK